MSNRNTWYNQISKLELRISDILIIGYGLYYPDRALIAWWTKDQNESRTHIVYLPVPKTGDAFQHGVVISGNKPSAGK